MDEGLTSTYDILQDIPNDGHWSEASEILDECPREVAQRLALAARSKMRPSKVSHARSSLRRVAIHNFRHHGGPKSSHFFVRTLLLYTVRQVRLGIPALGEIMGRPSSSDT
jgi:hypothetical protein